MNAARTGKSLSCSARTRGLLSPAVRIPDANGGLDIDRNETVLQSEQDQLRVTLQVKNIHDVMLMKLDSLLAQFQEPSDLLHPTSFSQQLHHFSLSWGYFFRVLSRPGFRLDPIHRPQPGCNVGLAMQYVINRR